MVIVVIVARRRLVFHSYHLLAGQQLTMYDGGLLPEEVKRSANALQDDRDQSDRTVKLVGSAKKRILNGNEIHASGNASGNLSGNGNVSDPPLPRILQTVLVSSVNASVSYANDHHESENGRPSGI